MPASAEPGPGRPDSAQRPGPARSPPPHPPAPTIGPVVTASPRCATPIQPLLITPAWPLLTPGPTPLTTGPADLDHRSRAVVGERGCIYSARLQLASWQAGSATQGERTCTHLQSLAHMRSHILCLCTQSNGGGRCASAASAASAGSGSVTRIHKSAHAAAADGFAHSRVTVMTRIWLEHES